VELCMNTSRAPATRDAFAMITAGDDERLMRQMWESKLRDDWEVARQLAAIAAGALQVLAECQSRSEEEVLVELMMQWADA
jgi:hypothetical protein